MSGTVPRMAAAPFPLPPLELLDPDGHDWVGRLPPEGDEGEAAQWVPPFGRWMIWTCDDEISARLRLHVWPGRIRVTEVWVNAQDDGGEDLAISAAHMRAVPLGRITEFLNAPNIAAAVQGAFGVNPEDQPPLPLGPDFTDDPEAAYRIDGINQTRRPDTFYRDVALAVGVALSRGSREAAAIIARANDVPTTTVYRWIREARKRGVMAPSGHGPRTRAGADPGRRKASKH